jgi:hypothetical protein
MGEKWDAYRLLAGRGLLRRQSRRWVRNIRMDLVDVGWTGLSGSGWRALVNSVMNLRVP